MSVVLGLFACAAFVAFVAFAVLVAWPWRIDASLKAVTNASSISMAGGVEVAGLSASAAAILGGPGAIAVHLRSRQMWKRSIPHVSPVLLLDYFDRPKEPPPHEAGREARSKSKSRVKDYLLARTDISALPELGLRVLLDLREVSFNGALTCGFSDPVITGKAAAWLFPIAGMLGPYGVFDLTFDWTGQNRVDGGLDKLSFRVVPLRVALAALGFVRRHVHFFRTISPTLPTSLTT